MRFYQILQDSWGFLGTLEYDRNPKLYNFKRFLRSDFMQDMFEFSKHLSE